MPRKHEGEPGKREMPKLFHRGGREELARDRDRRRAAADEKGAKQLEQIRFDVETGRLDRRNEREQLKMQPRNKKTFKYDPSKEGQN